MRTGTNGGVTIAQFVPTRSSSHCIEAGTEFAPDATFWRKLKRSMAAPSVPVVAEIKPLVGADGAPKVEAFGLIQSEAALGEIPKSNLPTRKIVSPA